jgi:hypothetical protein
MPRPNPAELFTARYNAIAGTMLADPADPLVGQRRLIRTSRFFAARTVQFGMNENTKLLIDGLRYLEAIMLDKLNVSPTNPIYRTEIAIKLLRIRASAGVEYRKLLIKSGQVARMLQTKTGKIFHPTH